MDRRSILLDTLNFAICNVASVDFKDFLIAKNCVLTLYIANFVKPRLTTIPRVTNVNHGHMLGH